ncbi:DUF928 domain-containing protein [Dapis sp. BLCC M172]|uniref:DUF928 domain-containing protein n=1 Tax=Dapis sp. BLCC M172 TaxID=2975281 RepID=UPI003CF7058A
MMGRQNIKSWGLLALAISPIIVTFSGWQLAKAEQTPELLISVDFEGGKRSPSGRTSGGGTRGPSKGNLIALMPGDDNAGTTISNPNFFVYIPEHEAESAEFEIFDKSGKSIYLNDELDVSGTSGIVKLTVPKDVSLTNNKEYKWRFAIIFDPWDRSADKFVEGTIKKVEISSQLEKSLKNATPLEQAEIYANAKIWNETIATLAELRNSNPTEWEELLTSVGLKEIASEPFVPCCKPKAE